MSWTWWMTVLVILAVLVLIGCIPVGVDAAYGEGGVLLSAKIGFFRLQVLPAKPKKTHNFIRLPAMGARGIDRRAHDLVQNRIVHRTVGIAPDAPAAEAAPQKKLALPGGLNGILRLVNLALSTLGDLRRMLRVEELTLHVCIGGSDDPAAAAIRYGRAWAAIGAITPALDRLFVIKKRDIQPALDYNETSMKVDARLITTITIGRSLALALHAGVRFLKILNQRKKAV